MGWWRIDPETGMPLDAPSALSQPPDFVLLNAVPEVDADEEAFYLGDGPWDMASTVPDEIEAVAGAIRLTEEELRDLLLRRVVPSRAGQEAAAGLLRVVDALWQDVDGCYEDDWDRKARPAEQRWVCEYAVQCAAERGDDLDK